MSISQGYHDIDHLNEIVFKSTGDHTTNNKAFVVLNFKKKNSIGNIFKKHRKGLLLEWFGNYSAQTIHNSCSF